MTPENPNSRPMSGLGANAEAKAPSVGILFTNTEGAITSCNENALSILNSVREVILGKPLGCIVSSKDLNDDFSDEQALTKSILDDVRKDGQYQSGGSSFSGHCCVTLLRDGKFAVTGIIAVLTPAENKAQVPAVAHKEGKLE